MIKQDVKKLKWSQWLAWLLVGFCLVGAGVNLVQGWLVQNGRFTLPNLMQMLGWSLTLPLLYSLMGALIIARQPYNRVGWFIMMPALVTAVPFGTLLTTPPTTVTPGLRLLLWFDNWSWIPVIFSVFLILLHFPTGRPPSPKWNWINWLALGMWLVFASLVPFFEAIGPLNETWQIPNAIGFISFTFWEAMAPVWSSGLGGLAVGSIVSLTVRYRRADTKERQQIKWLLYGGVLFASSYIPSVLIDSNSDRAWLLDFLFFFAMLTLPMAIAIAILRYRLWDIDLIIRKTVQYGVITAVLALVYFGTIILLQSLIGQATGEQSPLVIVLSTLLIVGLFNPLWRRVQDVVDRRFYRQKYNAQQVLAQFAQTARDEVDIEALQAELLRVVQETMQPEQVSIWLK